MNTNNASSSSPPNNNQLPRLYQLDGFRFLVALWLVVGHNFDPNNDTSYHCYYERFCVRRYVAVSFFIILSGFVSHYAYGQKEFFPTNKNNNNSNNPVVDDSSNNRSSSWWWWNWSKCCVGPISSWKSTMNYETSFRLRKFYIGRIGSMLSCYYATLVMSMGIRLYSNHYTINQILVGLPLSIFLVQTWIPKYAYFGNTPSWTLSTLVTHWILYPFALQTFVNNLSYQRLQLWTYVLVPILSLVPSFVFLFLVGDTFGQLPNHRIWYVLYTHPIFRLPDFVYGALLSELFLRNYQLKKTKTTKNPTTNTTTVCVSEDGNDGTTGNEEEEEQANLTPTISTTTTTNTTASATTATNRILGILSDLVLPIIFALILFVPLSNNGKGRSGIYDTLMIEVPMHLFGLLIYGSSISFVATTRNGNTGTDDAARSRSESTRTVFGSIMSWGVCRNLGDFAFQVYLWRWPLFAFIHIFETGGQLKKGWMALSLPYFIPAVIFLYAFSYYWYLKVDTPIRQHLVEVTTTTITKIQLKPTTKATIDNDMLSEPLTTSTGITTIEDDIGKKETELPRERGIV